MASETFKKRQKEMARREKKQKKMARLMERRNNKAQGGSTLDEQTAQIAQPTEWVGQKI